MISWTDTVIDGPPEADGKYLCAFSNGDVETFNYWIGDVDWWHEPSEDGVIVTHWAKHPDHPSDREKPDDGLGGLINEAVKVWKRLRHTENLDGLFEALVNVKGLDSKW